MPGFRCSKAQHSPKLIGVNLATHFIVRLRRLKELGRVGLINVEREPERRGTRVVVLLKYPHQLVSKCFLQAHRIVLDDPGQGVRMKVGDSLAESSRCRPLAQSLA